MRTDELDYDLPPELVAQRPPARRGDSRLLVHRSATGGIEHRHIAELPELLAPDDLVIVNTTRVVRARLHLRRPTGGAVEVLLVEDLGDGEWEALARPSRRLRTGMRLEGDGLAVEVGAALGDGRWRVRPAPGGDALHAALERAGELPLPPYVRERPLDEGRYQTVYADRPGSAAAPTAGLHFSDELYARLRARCQVAPVELRVGLDTFRPVAAERLEDHRIHSEAYAVPAGTRRLLERAGGEGRRVVCVGTTSLRVVETVADPAAPDAGRTRLFVTPGYRFRTAGALLTNFHLPRSTLLALVMAFCGVEETRRVYAAAIAERYRFFSFGDACLFL